MTNDFDPDAIRKQLVALRTRHGVDSPVGHRCSNLLGQLENLALYPADSKMEHRKDLEKLIAKSVADLASLSSGGTSHAEERNTP